MRCPNKLIRLSGLTLSPINALPRQIVGAHRRTNMATIFRSPIEAMVEQLFSNIKAKRGECCDNPVTGGGFVWGLDPIRNVSMTLEHLVS
jgi:hypothetical protein